MLSKKLKGLLGRNKANLSGSKNALKKLSGFELKLPAGTGFHYQDRLSLYRFLAESIPILNGAIWLWTRLCSSPVAFDFSELSPTARDRLLSNLDRVLTPFSYQKSGGFETLVNMFFRNLFIDGGFGGQVVLNRAANRIAGFVPADSKLLSFEYEADDWQIYFEADGEKNRLDPGSFYYGGLDSTAHDPRGTSLLASIGFVSHIEQKLIRDMSQALEKSGYQRIQVQLAKPERLSGENDSNYIERANRYFESTVDLMKNLKPADSAVTWDDVQINAIGPSGQGAASSWYLYHRALVEDICAGVHLDPFMLGYSYGTTQTWARFKFELMLRQIVAVQEKARGFLKWLIELAMDLEGLPGHVEVIFDNQRVFGSLERYKAESIMAENIISQYQAGLLDEKEARTRLQKIEPGIV